MLGAGAARRDARYGGPPVILLTVNDPETDIVTGLTLGADDYITKPFFTGRAARPRRPRCSRNAPAAAPAVFEQDRFRFDFDRLDFAPGGRPLQFLQTEQRLLRLLVENAGIPCRATRCSTASGRTGRTMWT